MVTFDYSDPKTFSEQVKPYVDKVAEAMGLAGLRIANGGGRVGVSWVNSYSKESESSEPSDYLSKWIAALAQGRSSGADAMLGLSFRGGDGVGCNDLISEDYQLFQDAGSSLNDSLRKAVEQGKATEQQTVLTDGLLMAEILYKATADKKYESMVHAIHKHENDEVKATGNANDNTIRELIANRRKQLGVE